MGVHHTLLSPFGTPQNIFFKGRGQHTFLLSIKSKLLSVVRGTLTPPLSRLSALRGQHPRLFLCMCQPPGLERSPRIFTCPALSSHRSVSKFSSPEDPPAPHSLCMTAHSPLISFKTHTCPQAPTARSSFTGAPPAPQPPALHGAACRVPTDTGSKGSPGPRQAVSTR